MPSTQDTSNGIYVGKVMHQRNRPFYYHFSYSVFSLKVDIDHLEQQTDKLRWLSLNKFNLLSLRFKDHGARDGTPWRQWFDSLMQSYGMETPAAKVELLCFPRVLGYSFNPLAMWFAYDANQQLQAVVAEVSNTFGQWHHYVLYQQNGTLPVPTQCEADKVFHVSPFIDMQQRYAFRFKAPTSEYHMRILELDASDDDQPLLIATQAARYQPLTDNNLMKQFIRLPWQSLKVIGMIHWWALKIWLKGGKFHRTPVNQRSVDYSHSAMILDSSGLNARGLASSDDFKEVST